MYYNRYTGKFFLNDSEKKQIIINALKKSSSIDDEKIADFLLNNIYSKSSLIFEISKDENEIFNHLEAFIQSSLNAIERDKDKMTDNLSNERDLTDLIEDPKNLSFDISGEIEYSKKMLRKLSELDGLKPNKDYISIFYRKYIKNESMQEIAKELKISEKEAVARIFDIVKFTGKE